MAQVPQCAGKAWFHVDMDGLDAIYQAHGREYDRDRDDFYTSAVANALTFFGEQDVRATFFLIARDLDDPRKRAAIDAVVASGHRIGCHGLRHRYLDRSTLAEKREEIFDGKRKIEDALGVPVAGFRAPGYSIDHQSLALLRDAGYRYDTSIFPNHAVRKRLGIQRLFQDPFLMYPESGFFEIPMPDLGLWRPPFHPCYAFYLRRPYFEYALRRYAERSRYLTFLFHLTDFATPQVLKGDFGLRFYTNDFFSAESKRAFLTKLVGSTRQRYDITTTEEFLAGWPASAPDLNPRTILGISTTHETGACIVKDGLVLSAISEERLSRRKLDTTYPPVRAIEEAIDVARVQPDEIDAVAVAGLHWRDLLPLTLESLRADLADFHSWNDYFPHFARSLYREFYFWRATRYRRVGDFLRKKYRISPKIYYVEHHEAHASSAFRTGAHDRTLIVTADGVGDEICITFSKGEGSLIRRIETFFYPHSFGHFYTACTQILGFKGGRHEGKITGLSGFGKPNDELLRKLEGTLRLDGDSFRLDKRYYVEGFVRPSRHDLKNLLRGRLNTLTVDYRNYKKPLKKLLQGYTREDVAYAFQHLLEREMVRLARRHVDGTPLHLVLAGGVFANVKLNMALSQELKPETIFIFPNMGDGGLCVGAALSIHAPSPSPIPHVYLGT
ncbi:MAG TPA: carbamoyltransferase N-terminal domain-containing protein, partial [Rhodothermales bacterium]